MLASGAKSLDPGGRRIGGRANQTTSLKIRNNLEQFSMLPVSEKKIP